MATAESTSTQRRQSFKDKAKERLGMTFSNAGDMLKSAAESPFSLLQGGWERVKSKSIEVKNQLFHDENNPPQNNQPGETGEIHGVMNPLDSESLPPELREKLDAPKPVFKDMAGEEEETADKTIEQATERKKSATKTVKPKGTITYTVQDRDTLASIAAQYDTTPSEVAKLNKMGMSRMIFPGKVLDVPDKNYGSSESSSPSLSPTDVTKKNVEGAAPTPPGSPPGSQPGSPEIPIVGQIELPKGPGLAERQEPSQQAQGEGKAAAEADLPRALSDEEALQLDQECYERFIKVNVKHITDGQGVVKGVLLVTPNAIMFDPDVMDPLVIEHGAEKYGMVAPMETIISAAIYHDIAAMKLHMQNKDPNSPDSPKPVVYHAKDCPLYHKVESKDTKTETEVAQEQEVVDKNENKVNADDITECTEADSTSRGMPENRSDGVCSCGALKELDQRLQAEAEAAQAASNGADVPPGEAGAEDTVAMATSANNQTVPNTSQGSKEEANITEGQDEVKVTDIPKGHKSVAAEEGLDSKASQSVSDTDNGAEEKVNFSIGNGTEDTQKDESVNGTREDGEQKESTTSPPPLTPHMTIGNIEYFQYGDMPAKPPGDPSQKQNGETSSEAKPDTESIAEASGVSTEAEATDNAPEEPPGSATSAGSKASILSRTWGSISSVGSFVSSSPGISTIVDFSSGLFARTQEDQGKVKDLSEVDTVSPPPKGVWYTENSGHSASKHHDVEVENVVKLDDKPELFKSLDELIPRPAVLYEDPPLYLCLKVGKPLNKVVSKTCAIEGYMKKKRKPEYWFSVPRDRVDHLYAFFIQWSPKIYGSGDDVDLKERGFMVIESDEDDMDMIEDYFDSENSKRLVKQMTKDWEIVNLEEIKRRQSLLEEEALTLPDMSDPSTLLNEEQMRKLLKNLPPRAVGYPWRLVYSSDKHGFSLKTLYRAMQTIDSPSLIVLKDTNSQIFGAMTSCALKISEHFYGTGESFLYTFYPEFKKFSWTGENNFFIKGNTESLAIGAGEGSFGLWLDGDIYHGRTQHCQTYDNDILTMQEDFMVKGMEVWVFD